MHPMTKSEQFDKAFRPYSPEVLPHIPGKPEMMRVNGHLVSQE